MAEAPDTHPAPRDWWRHILIMAYMGAAGMAGEAVVAAMAGDTQGGAAVVRALGWAALATTYGAGSTLIDAIRAWRGGDAG